MKVTLIRFSQTGNTRKVARAMAEALDAAGARVRSVALKKARAQDALDADLIGVGTPCFSSRAPLPVRELLAALPRLDGRRAFVFATSGGGPGRVLYDLADALRQKGADVAGGIVIRGECFHPFPEIYGRFPGRPDAKDLEEARRFARSVFEHVSAGTPGPLPGTRPDVFRAGGFYNYVAFMNRDDYLRKILKAPEADPDKCTRCRWCEYDCPVNNITLDPYPVLGGRCIRCYRCFSGCPEHAFSADLRLGNLMAVMFYNTLFERYLGDVRKGERFY
ncbi:MAG TPA: EFR1 family ferrodoxin [bacterium]|nr:EFR1 family ferrodoxin [bacterium]